MQYEDAPALSREQAESMMDSGSADDKIRALLSVTLNGEDRRWVEQRCLDFLDGEDPSVRRIAVICLGHLARIHGELDLQTVLPRLERLSDDPAVAGEVEDALDDISMFAK